jgi:hypothetical protein
VIFQQGNQAIAAGACADFSGLKKGAYPVPAERRWNATSVRVCVHLGRLKRAQRFRSAFSRFLCEQTGKPRFGANFPRWEASGSHSENQIPHSKNDFFSEEFHFLSLEFHFFPEENEIFS